MAQKGGVGIQLNADSPRVRIVGLKPGGPAFECGHMLIGDELCSVDGTDVVGYKLEKVARMLGGDAGTTVQVIVLRPGTRQRTVVSLVRESMGPAPAERTRPGSSDTAASSASGDAFRLGGERRSGGGSPQGRRARSEALSEGDSTAMVSPQSTWEEVQGTVQDCLARVRADGGARGLATARTLLALAAPLPAGARAFHSSGAEGDGRAGRVLEVLRFVREWARQAGAERVQELPYQEGEEGAWWGAAGAPMSPGAPALQGAEEAGDGASMARLPVLLAVFRGRNCDAPQAAVVVHLHADSHPGSTAAPGEGEGGEGEGERLHGADGGLVALAAWMAAIDAQQGVGMELPRRVVLVIEGAFHAGSPALAQRLSLALAERACPGPRPAGRSSAIDESLLGGCPVDITICGAHAWPHHTVPALCCGSRAQVELRVTVSRVAHGEDGKEDSGAARGGRAEAGGGQGWEPAAAGAGARRDGMVDLSLAAPYYAPGGSHI
ncbi:hypothetical protein T484DRAFT_1908749, partial [Baffinella frigidus]